MIEPWYSRDQKTTQRENQVSSQDSGVRARWTGPVYLLV